LQSGKAARASRLTPQDERFGTVDEVGAAHAKAAPEDPRFVEVEQADDAHVSRRAFEAIESRYEELGRAAGPMGRGASKGLTVEPDGGLRRDFRGGHITYSPGTDGVHVVVTKVAEVVYKGLKCFGRQGGVGTDSPYVILSVVLADPQFRVKILSFRAPETGTYEGVSDGDTRTDGQRVIWSGPPQDLVLHTAVIEHDSGDPEYVRGAVQIALYEAAKRELDKLDYKLDVKRLNGVEVATSAVDGGPPYHELLDPDTFGVLSGVNYFADKIAGLFGPGEDNLGDGTIVIPAGAWEDGQIPPLMTRDGIEYNAKQYCTDGDASYDVMYELKLSRVTRVL